MKKILAISSVLLGVVFLAGCGQQPVSQTQPTTPVPVAQTPTQPVATQPAPTTEALVTYTNTKYGIEFRYPNNFGEQIVVDNDKKTDLRLNADKGSIEMIAIPATEESFSSKSTFAKWHASSEEISGNEIKDVSLESLNGYDIFRTHEADGIDTISDYVYFHKQNRVIIFSNGFTDKKLGLEMLNEIISTFKFTK
jgi:hypothetical protein